MRNIVLVLVLFMACKDAPPRAPDNTTPHDLMTRWSAVVVGTLGDDHADRIVATQAAIAGGYFGDALIVKDLDFDAAAWPEGVVLYGGPHVNAVVRDLAPTLPFTMTSSRLTIGGADLDGDDIRLIAAVPAGPTPDGGSHPDFVLYAGTGMPGVAEINAIHHGAEPIVIADRFGRLVTGPTRRPWRRACVA